MVLAGAVRWMLRGVFPVSCDRSGDAYLMFPTLWAALRAAGLLSMVWCIVGPATSVWYIVQSVPNWHESWIAVCVVAVCCAWGALFFAAADDVVRVCLRMGSRLWAVVPCELWQLPLALVAVAVCLCVGPLSVLCIQFILFARETTLLRAVLRKRVRHVAECVRLYRQRLFRLQALQTRREMYEKAVSAAGCTVDAQLPGYQELQRPASFNLRPRLDASTAPAPLPPLPPLVPPPAPPAASSPSPDLGAPPPAPSDASTAAPPAASGSPE
jgi:hypothetical protein